MAILRWLKLFVSGHSRYSRCWMGLHRWSMPGGWCERCGICDRFLPAMHKDCGKICRYKPPTPINPAAEE